MEENQQVQDLPTYKFSWVIENFKRLNVKKHYSEVFIACGYKWRILVFPKGNNVDHLSIYLDVVDSQSLPLGWSRRAQFSFAVINQVQSKYTIRKVTDHQFNARESDWGFTSFMPLSEIYDPTRGFLLNGSLMIEAEVTVRRVVDNRAQDSQTEMDYVGLKNQGATGYMNSLLQILYHVPYFRKAVYNIPTTEYDLLSGSISLALQSMFYNLQYSETSVNTKDLTKSFGWDIHHLSMPHHVQEFKRVLLEKLGDKMKGTIVEGTIQHLFEGHCMNYIECINVSYKSTRKESFYDVQLDVKGCKDVYASFDKYIEVDRLEGDNKYHAEEYGLQDAKKGTLFFDFPSVLLLQLKRFEYDYWYKKMVKINDRYEFPLQLDLDRDNGKYLSTDADRSVRNLYTLHSVLAHSGEVIEGHYSTFIRPTLSDQWYYFDDERVTKEDMERALEEQYGGKEEANPGSNNSNAYILVYIRKSEKEKIFHDVDEQDIAEHLRVRLKKEKEDKELQKKEKAEAQLYTIIKIARDDDLMGQIGRDFYFDLVDHDKVRSLRIQKDVSFNIFKEEIAKEFGIPVQFQRFWLWARRQNNTVRPNRPLTPLEEMKPVGQLGVSNNPQNSELKLFLEVDLGLDKIPRALPEKTNDDILLFFKLYVPEKQELRYIGRLFVKSMGKPAEILRKLNELAGFSPTAEIDLYEEIKFEPYVLCELVDKNVSFRSSQLEDGDIICYQIHPKHDAKWPYLDVPSFLTYAHNRQVVHFRSLEKPKEEGFSLELSKLHNYDDVVKKLAAHLGLDDAAKIRLTSHNCYSQQPKPQPINDRSVEHLIDMLTHNNQTSDILYYEVLGISLPDLQCLKTLKVVFHHSTMNEAVIHSIMLPKSSTVGDVLADLKKRVDLSHPAAELRLLEVFHHRIYKVFKVNEKIENINDQFWILRAEEIPEEEKELGVHDYLIHVYHFMKDPINQMKILNFGEPFFLVIHEGETFASVKERIQKKLQVPDEEYSTWKFAFVTLGRPKYLQDIDIMSRHLQNQNIYGAWEKYIGLEHSDTSPQRVYSSNQSRHTLEKPMKTTSTGAATTTSTRATPTPASISTTAPSTTLPTTLATSTNTTPTTTPSTSAPTLPTTVATTTISPINATFTTPTTTAHVTPTNRIATTTAIPTTIPITTTTTTSPRIPTIFATTTTTPTIPTTTLPITIATTTGTPTIPTTTTTTPTTIPTIITTTTTTPTIPTTALPTTIATTTGTPTIITTNNSTTNVPTTASSTTTPTTKPTTTITTMTTTTSTTTFPTAIATNTAPITTRPTTIATTTTLTTITNTTTPVVDGATTTTITTTTTTTTITTSTTPTTTCF